MAEEAQIMIFPHLNISELEQDMEQKKRKLEDSTDQFLSTSREILNPLKFIMENKKTVLAGIVSLIAVGKIVGKVGKVAGATFKSSTIFSLFKAAWVWKILKLGYHFYTLTNSKPKRSLRT